MPANSSSPINDEFNIKLIEKNTEISELASEKLDNVLILNADAADQEFLGSEAIEDCDAFVAVTQDDETNVLCSLMAKKLGATKEGPYSILDKIIKTGSKIAINISEKI